MLIHGFIFWLSLGVATSAAPLAIECDRAALLAAADKYVTAQTTGKLDALQTILATNFTYQENNLVSDPKKGVLSKALKINNRRSIADTLSCASYTELIAISAPSPYVIGTQIRHDPSSMNITLIDAIASTTGAWLFNATATLAYAQRETWSEIPAPKRDSRAALQAAADAYLDMWSNKSAVDAVPWGTPCARLEGGVYTGQGLPSDSCKLGAPTNSSQAPNDHRRYVIDDVYGSCSVLCVFTHMSHAADSHEFRLEGGRLRYVHTMDNCAGAACKLD